MEPSQLAHFSIGYTKARQAATQKAAKNSYPVGLNVPTYSIKIFKLVVVIQLLQYHGAILIYRGWGLLNKFEGKKTN